MARKHYLVCYDIADDRRRNRVFETLQDFGDHTQFSVFLCDLDAAELASLRQTLEEIVHAREDQVLLVDLGPAHNDLQADIESVGRAFDPAPRAYIV